MKLIDTNIQNYRCFDNTRFSFGGQCTVLIGKNGTGKSSLIKAITTSLSFIFNKSNNSWGYPSLANEVTDLSVAGINVREIHHDSITICDYVDIETNATLRSCVNSDAPDNGLNWHMRRNATERAALQSSLYKDAYIKFRQRLETTDCYPLLVSYSDRYPHINTNLGSNVKALLNSDDYITRTWGYYHWNEFTSCTEIWQRRFIRISNRLLYIERHLNDKINPPELKAKLEADHAAITAEIEYVSEYLRRFSDNNIDKLSDRAGDFKIAALDVDGDSTHYIKFIFEDGVERAWHELPAGLERLFSIVFDMAYRSFILNRGLHEPEGIVLIDEVDLHLHPSLQQDVMLRFKHTFSNVQFIVSTHSPLVINNLLQDDDNIVIQMSRHGGSYSHERITNLYTYDYEYTIRNVMQTPARNSIIETLSARYVRLCLRGRDEQAREVLNTLHGMLDKETFDNLVTRLHNEIKQG